MWVLLLCILSTVVYVTNGGGENPLNVIAESIEFPIHELIEKKIKGVMDLMKDDDYSSEFVNWFNSFSETKYGKELMKICNSLLAVDGPMSKLAQIQSIMSNPSEMSKIVDVFMDICSIDQDASPRLQALFDGSKKEVIGLYQSLVSLSVEEKDFIKKAMTGKLETVTSANGQLILSEKDHLIEYVLIQKLMVLFGLDSTEMYLINSAMKTGEISAVLTNDPLIQKLMHKVYEKFGARIDRLLEIVNDHSSGIAKEFSGIFQEIIDVFVSFMNNKLELSKFLDYVKDPNLRLRAEIIKMLKEICGKATRKKRIYDLIVIANVCLILKADDLAKEFEQVLAKAKIQAGLLLVFRHSISKASPSMQEMFKKQAEDLEKIFAKKKGMSTGTKVLIGVGIGLVVLAISCGIFVYFRYRVRG